MENNENLNKNEEIGLVNSINKILNISNDKIELNTNPNMNKINNDNLSQNYNYNENDMIDSKNNKIISNDSNEIKFPDNSTNETIKIIKGDFPTEEIKEWEQYFFTEKVLLDIIDALEFEENILCLCTPAVADAFWRIKQKKIICLDIDKRFTYLPGFIYFDILKPHKIDFKPNVIIVDPPFFKLNLVDLYNTIDFLTEKDRSTKLIFAFVKREQKFLLYNFNSYNIQLTKYKLEYRSVDPTKWDNYGIYTNYEFKKMKFLDKKLKEKNNNIGHKLEKNNIKINKEKKKK